MCGLRELEQVGAEWHFRGFEGLVSSIIGGGEGIGVGAGCKQSRESGILRGFNSSGNMC